MCQRFIDRKPAGAGLSFDDAARAVLDDDQRILCTLLDNPRARAEVFDRTAREVWRQVRANAANHATPALPAAPSPPGIPC